MCSFLNTRAQKKSRHYPFAQNFYAKDDVAYTEDHILIQKLFLYNVAPTLLPHEVQAYFEKFGHIVRLQIFDQPKNASPASLVTYSGKPRPKNGYIFFSDARSAAKVLKRAVYYVNGSRLCVQPNDSWHQPEAYGYPRYPLTPLPNPSLLDIYTDTPVPPIMTLNDHCLEHILRLLPVVDRIHFARTCVRFRGIYQGVSPALDKIVNLDVFYRMTVWDMRDFFQLSGQYVKSLEGVLPSRHMQRLCEFLGSHCINLETLGILGAKLTARHIQKLMAKLDNLQDLELSSCDLSDDGILALKNLPALKSLNLCNNFKLSGLYMDKLPNVIESLTLNGCIKIQPIILANICAALPNLKNLHLKGIPEIGSGFQVLVGKKSCESVESLLISCGNGPNSSYEKLAELPSLKQLTIHSYQGNKPLRKELFESLAKHKANQLQHFEARGEDSISSISMLQIGKLTSLRTLKLPNNDTIDDLGLEALCALSNLEEINLKSCANISNHAVLRLVFACPKLRTLHLEQCQKLTDKLITDLIFKLRLLISQKENQRSLPIKLFLSGQQISKAKLQLPAVAAKDLVDVSFAEPERSSFNMADMLEFEFDDGQRLNSVNNGQYYYDVGFLSGEEDFDDFYSDDDDYDDDDDYLMDASDIDDNFDE